MALTKIKLAQMDANSVDSDQYVDGSIDNAHLADDAVDSAKLANNITLGGTLTVGVDDTGHDVKFFGASSGKYWEWDESADKMVVAGTADINGKVESIGIDNAGQFNIKPGGEFFSFENSSAWHLTYDKTAGYTGGGASWTYGIDVTKSYVKLYGGEDGSSKDATVVLQTKTTGIDVTGVLDVTGTVTDSKGDVRSIPQNSKSASYKPTDRSDVGKHIYTDSAVEIADAAGGGTTWVIGDAITIVNKDASANVVITFTNITAYIAGDATAKSTITVAARGMGTILFTTATECFVGGAGLS